MQLMPLIIGVIVDSCVYINSLAWQQLEGTKFAVIIDEETKQISLKNLTAFELANAV